MPDKISFKDKKAYVLGIDDESLLRVGLPQIEWERRGSQLAALCPFHREEHIGSFSYSPSKHVWRCFTCGKSGSGPVSLIMAATGVGFKPVIESLYDQLGPNGGSALNLLPQKAVPKAEEERRPDGFAGTVSPEEKDLIYRSFAAASPLTKEEAAKLAETRGLKADELRDFFSFPRGTADFWEKFRAELRRSEQAASMQSGTLWSRLLVTPGFFWDRQEKQVCFTGVPGALGILNHDTTHRITSIEMRLNDRMSGSRYIGFSGSAKCAADPERFGFSTSAGALVDIVPVEKTTGRKIRGIAITEGKFKAIYLSRFGYTVVNVHGVSNWQKALPVLKELAPDGLAGLKVDIYYDADSQTNPAVASMSLALGQALLDSGCDCGFVTWPVELGKGFDDLAKAGYCKAAKRVPANIYIKETIEPFLAEAQAEGFGFTMPQRLSKK